MKTLTAIVTGVAFAATLSLNAAQPENTITACIDLLPEGHEFDLTINVVVNTKADPFDTNGGFTLKDGTGASPASFSQAQATPFVECIKSLL